MKRILAMGCALAAIAGCGNDTMMGEPDASVPPDLTMQPDLVKGPDLAMQGPSLKHESKSSAIAISDDDALLAAVSPDDDILYIIKTADKSSVAVHLAAGCEPRSVAFAPDVSFWVACRGNGTAVHVS